MVVFLQNHKANSTPYIKLSSPSFSQPQLLKKPWRLIFTTTLPLGNWLIHFCHNLCYCKSLWNLIIIIVVNTKEYSYLTFTFTFTFTLTEKDEMMYIFIPSSDAQTDWTVHTMSRLVKAKLMNQIASFHCSHEDLNTLS